MNKKRKEVKQYRDKLYETEITINDKFHVLHNGDIICLISDNEAVTMTTSQLKSIYQLVFPDKKENDPGVEAL